MNKKLLFTGILLLSSLLTACAGPDPQAATTDELLVLTDGTTEVAYSAADLQAFPAAQASFGEITYIGVPLASLLKEAGFDPQSMRAVKAVAEDGFSANYDPGLANQPDTLVAYARADGPLAEDEGPFRMVLPAQEGKMNVRILSRLELVP